MSTDTPSLPHSGFISTGLSSIAKSIRTSLPGPGIASTFVHPCVIDGHVTLVYERGLPESKPRIFKHIQTYANVYGLKLLEDRRKNFIDGIKRVERRHNANVISVLALTAALLTSPVVALEKEHLEHFNIQPSSAAQQTEVDLNLQIETSGTQQEIVSAMFTWINQHSKFDHDISQLPEIVQVPALKMAEIAFGGNLPLSVEPENLDIYGLYNFHEGKIYIIDSLDLETDQGKGVLLHELVHYLQYQYGDDESAACKNELESLAYLLEAKFLQSRDHVHNIDEGHIERVSQCN